MAFSSVMSLFQFLPIALILYYISPKKAKNSVLFAASLVFYAWGQLRHLPVLVAVIAANYFFALMFEKFETKKVVHRLLLTAALVFNFGLLFVFKYLDFFSANINTMLSVNIPLLGLSLPLGISFYMLHALSYTLDVYRKKVYAESNFIDLAVFMSLFPQLMPSLVVQYRDINAELRSRTVTVTDLDSGVEDLIIGLARKVIVANSLAPLWGEIQNIGLITVSTGLAWLSVIVYGLQIYFEFSGYSQMAIGIAKMLGFHFPKNYDSPYSAHSITDFWRSWNITLGRWFKEYVYIPMGGSRKGSLRTILNLFVVWALIGLWHGASWMFVLWGLYFFLLLTIERIGFLGFLNKHHFFSRVYTIFAVIIGWAIFASPDFSYLQLLVAKMFVPTMINNTASVTMWYYLRNYAVSIIVACFFATKTSSGLYARFREHRFLRNLVLVVLFLLSIAYLIDPAWNPFQYFSF